ncbi:MAG TPA: acyl-CoA synthetase [Pseudomonadales bacterium]
MSRLAEHAQNQGSKAALIDAETGAVLTFDELNRRSIRCARLLRREGLRFGDHIAVMTENLPDALVVAWAALRSGLYLTPVNWHLTADEAGYIVRDCMAKWLLISPGVGAVAAELDAELDPSVCRWTLGPAGGGYRSLEEGLAAESDEPLDEELEGELMFYSSGTTGRPKGILRALKRRSTDSEPNALSMLMAGLYGFSENTVYLCPAPLYHAAPLAWSLSVQRLGGTVVLMRRFDAARALELIERYRVNRAQFVPTMFVRMLKLPPEERARYDVSSLEAVIHAAAPCPVDVKQQMLDWWGPVIYEYYAGSEGGGFVAVGPEEWLKRPGTVGKPLTGAVHVVGDDGNDLPPGEVGVVYFDGNADFEYHGDPKKTRETYNDRGWHTLGDMGYLDEDGYLFLTDRKSHMIISGGVNIYPQEAENVLTGHPSVLDAAVIGVPHREYGEEVKAVVQLVDPAEASPELAQALIDYCLAHLAKYKCPRSVDFVDELPRLPTGKLLKRQLRERYWPAEGRRKV